jgi:hypothetical protein
MPAANASVHATLPAMDIYVKFVVWNLTSKAFEPVTNMPVDLMDNDPVSNDLIDTQTTDSNGCVHFSETQVTLKDKSGEDTPDLFFNARPKGLTAGGTALPDEWSTKGWNDQNGKPGFYPDAPFTAGDSLGSTAAAPLVYSIGLDFHVRYMYKDPKTGSPNVGAKGLEVNIWPPPGPDRPSSRTDKNGEFHGLVFDIKAGAEVYFEFDFDIADPSINLPESRVENTGTLSVNLWFTNTGDSDKVSYPNNVKTSIGTQTDPVHLLCSQDNRNVAMFFLTMLYEHTCFFFNISGGAWKGVEGLKFFMTAAAGTAYSWPLGSINIPQSDWGDRGTIMHELSHQVMWQEVGISSAGVVAQIVAGVVAPQSLCLTHYEAMLANPEHAMIEGWAEIFEGTFEPSALTFTTGTTLVDSNNSPVGPLGPPPVNQGQSVEGAFAQGMLGIFKSFVVGGAGSGSVPRSVNGDVTSTASWITDGGVKSRFQSAIWGPLLSLSSLSPSTTDFLAKLKSSNASSWPSMKTKLNPFNLALEPPTVTSILANSGPVAGGQSVTITGTGFVAGSTTVKIGNNAAASPSVLSDTSMTCNIPAGAAGAVDVVVTTSGGSATLTGGYTYTP